MWVRLIAFLLFPGHSNYHNSNNDSIFWHESFLSVSIQNHFKWWRKTLYSCHGLNKIEWKKIAEETILI